MAEACSFSPQQIKYEYPREWLPAGKNSLDFLIELCELGIQRRYSGRAPPAVRKQLNYEIKIVAELKFEDYFLTVWDIVQFARSQKILCQGRGSAANSVIADKNNTLHRTFFHQYSFVNSRPSIALPVTVEINSV